MRFFAVILVGAIASVATGATLAPRGVGLCLSATSNKFWTIQVMKCIAGDCEIEAEDTLSIDPIAFELSLGVGKCI
ncbi:hypothetical protein BDY19DRAFT_998268 [Irpex rosettiformis]|uniref:Uncharacterized protein n=1 Tax=Irpex rosettiformis TaxID=378272 RepID=A0ACB8TP69_9APHY|nr:hypothetical protein BDY19DRAFT_998268 [Irpex rosettiformis]